LSTEINIEVFNNKKLNNVRLNCNYSMMMINHFWNHLFVRLEKTGYLIVFKSERDCDKDKIEKEHCYPECFVHFPAEASNA